jgi:phosphatidylethanolamine/phosphatidyl-N-methylethanolamine N-methyltransferase
VAHRIARFARRDLNVRLIEVGAGTGALTRSLATIIDPSAITLVESDPRCCQQLRRRFPGIRIVEGLVENVTDQLIVPCDALVLVSSVPLFSLSAAQRNLVLSAYERIVKSAGECRMVQYTYVPWLPGKRVRQLCGKERGSVWRNLPPAWVWSATHQNHFVKDGTNPPMTVEVG